jgi:hypothetical protein
MTDRPWRDDDQLSPALREVIASAREDEPSTEAVASVERKLGALVALSAAPAAVSAVGGTTKGLGALKAKLLVGLLATGAGTYVAQRVITREQMPPPVVVAAPLPVSSVVEPPIEQPPVPVPEIEPSPAPIPQLLVPPHPARANHRAPAADTLADEAALLEQARRALAKAPAEALATADAHLKAFPGGVLSQEREVLAVDALWRLGRFPEARQRADRFLAGYPRSAHVPQVKAILERARP